MSILRSMAIQQRLADGIQLDEQDKQEMLSWKKTPSEFLKETSVKIVDFSFLKNCEEIQEEFLCECQSITSVNLQPFSRVEKVGGYFCYHNVNLLSVDFSAMISVTSIGRFFLAHCSSLMSVNLCGFVKVKNISYFFLDNCPKLSKAEYLDQVDLSPLLHLSDGDIKVYPEEGDRSLKSALARVRAGGANGPKLFSYSSSPSSSASSSATAASQNSSSSSSVCQNCQKLEHKLDCCEKEIVKLEQEKEGEKQQNHQLLNKQAERLRELTSEKQKLESDLASLKDENTRHLKTLHDQANELQDIKKQQQQGSNNNNNNNSSGVTSVSGNGNGGGVAEAVLQAEKKSLETLLTKAEAKEEEWKKEKEEWKKEKEELKKEKAELSAKNDKLLAKLLG